jgi:hypothetical protein
MTTTTTLPETPSWGVGWTQNDMMEKDTVLVLDERDNVIGSASKKTSHVFNAQQPHGILHRAFSVFVFERQSSRMLLQQRAHSKITFPNVRTRVCVYMDWYTYMYACVFFVILLCCCPVVAVVSRYDAPSPTYQFLH